MLRRVICCSLLIGQLCAGEPPLRPFPAGLNALDASAIITSDALELFDLDKWLFPCSGGDSDLELFGDFWSEFPDLMLPVSACKTGSGSAPEASGQIAKLTLPASIVPLSYPVPMPAMNAVPVPMLLNLQARSNARSSRFVKFTKEEDKQIWLYVETHKGRVCWKDCANALKTGRTAKQVSQRYIECLEFCDPNSEPATFCEEDDKWLVRQVACLGHKWGIIAQLRGKFSRTQLKNRWRHLQRCPALLEHYTADPEE